MSQRIINGDSAEVLKQFESNTIDAVVTDPPYGIEFLDKEWDKNTGAVEIWQECLRVLKPGGHLLAFSAARTYHHLATNIESVGFEVRDQIMWIYASGFPKAQQIPTHPGWRTGLKPAHEPIVMARRPLQGSCKANMATHGVGALNIDQSRIPYEDEKDLDTYVNNIRGPLERSTATAGDPIGMHEGRTGFRAQKGKVGEDFHTPEQGRFPSNVLGEIAGHQKYFYCPKVTQRERMSFNTHPTVKPVELMKYLVRLVAPHTAHIVDPFCGSGSTGMACRELGRSFTGIELDPAYCEIARRRITATKTDPKNRLFE
jgi:site-specific DNA-methyltransferase (adenine-specific)